jgi:hypothetical protein
MLEQPLREGEENLGIVGGVFDQHDELVSAEPGDDAAGADAGFQAAAGLTQQFVAVVVPEGVVDLLEAVEVDEDQPGVLP